jgi:hypothetical protein
MTISGTLAAPNRTSGEQSTITLPRWRGTSFGNQIASYNH